jgi:hypothetical protein
MSRPAAQPAAVHATMTVDDPSPARSRSRFTAWPLWGAAAGVFGFAATIVLDTRAGEPQNLEYTVTVRDMADLAPTMFRWGSFAGFLSVITLIVFAAVWHRRVVQRFPGSLGAPVVGYGALVSAAALSLAYGWKGALGNYLHGAMEEGTYDDQGLYVYYMLNDFSPFIGWLGMLGGLLGLVWMSFGEGLVSRGLGAVTGLISVGALLAVAVTGVPGLPFAALVGLLIAGVWLAVGRSAITQTLE